ncbi:MAG TPA: hypothetical protein VGO50_01070 [Pyrinomonadaceae bacterium]|jgi:hypothetical protein|nr:hypothetical protein [Pyrinomonadaceae bacterium]
MNTVISNNISAGPDQCCLFVSNGNSSQAAPAPANFNFNLQPYKFTAVSGQPENSIDERAELNRFIAFGKSLAPSGNAGSGLY